MQRTTAKSQKYKGEINVLNKNISNTSDRAIRIGNGTNVKISINSNTFSNCYEDRTDEKGEIINEVQINQGWQLLASNAFTESKLTFTNNTIDGVASDDIVKKTSELEPSINFIIYTQQPTQYVAPTPAE